MFCDGGIAEYFKKSSSFLNATLIRVKKRLPIRLLTKFFKKFLCTKTIRVCTTVLVGLLHLRICNTSVFKELKVSKQFATYYGSI